MHRFPFNLWVLPVLGLSVPLCLLNSSEALGQENAASDLTQPATAQPAEATSNFSDEQIAFFESKIRPVFIEHCVECHAADTEASGGLLLDSLAGWQAGGDSGPAILPGQPQQSRLLLAITYDDPDLQMPPEGQLPPQVVQDFENWIQAGAADVRDGGPVRAKKQTGLPVEQAQEHWAYRPLKNPVVPQTAPGSTSPIDAFLSTKLNTTGLATAPAASREAMIRRIYFDLIGLPPPVDAYEQMELDDDEFYAGLIDKLMDTPQFGEHFARKWMDVARYAESITLRGFVLPEAWRYRDYLIEAFSQDRPFDQMIREQVAGDLLDASNLHERSMQLVATGFLALGNTNLEQQDKTQLEMDYIDEQLEVMGRAFLGQTIGCARCHDHKFDPIPTRDYYALAGILRSAVGMEHENVSKWIELPLPLKPDEEQRFEQANLQLAAVNKRITELKKLAKSDATKPKRVAPGDLPGIVVDSSQAKLVGEWTESTFSPPVVGPSYLHDANSDKGMKTATFEPIALPPGDYSVRLAYTSGQNRATNALVRVFSADGEATIRVNQRQQPPEEDGWVSLGKYRFERDGQAFVLVSNAESDGHVVADAVQFLLASVPAKKSAGQASELATASQYGKQLSTGETTYALELEALQAESARLQAVVAERPRYLTLQETSPARDIRIHIRGDVHNLGDTVPRGFLTALAPAKPTFRSDSSGRLELANWLSSPDNPLTARVYANRVWSWVMGSGIVPSINNFGTTGTQPTHPELLDWLAQELIQSNWSTKHLVRTIMLSDAYRRAVIPADEQQTSIDPANALYWRGAMRRLPVESLRDAMLTISGELEDAVGGSTIKPGTKADYEYRHDSMRRSVYHPVLRNSLPELFEAFDFADPSMSIGQRPRSTVATQALVLLNHPWVSARASAAAKRLRDTYASASSSATDQEYLIRGMTRECLGREPTIAELSAAMQFLDSGAANGLDRFESLVHATFASVDFRYLD